MIESGIPILDKELEGLEKGIILAEGVPGSGKEVLGYHLINKALERGAACIVVNSTRNNTEVTKDLEYYKMKSTPVTWIDTLGGAEGENVISTNISELFTISSAIKKEVEKNAGKEIVLVLDLLSSALMSNNVQQVYKFFSGIVGELKKQNVTAYVIIENQMHERKDVAAMEQLSDIVFAFKVTEEELKVKQGMLIMKKLGRPIKNKELHFKLTDNGLEVE